MAIGYSSTSQITGQNHTAIDPVLLDSENYFCGLSSQACPHDVDAQSRPTSAISGRRKFRRTPFQHDIGETEADLGSLSLCYQHSRPGLCLAVESPEEANVGGQTIPRSPYSTKEQTKVVTSTNLKLRKRKRRQESNMLWASSVRSCTKPA